MRLKVAVKDKTVVEKSKLRVFNDIFERCNEFTCLQDSTTVLTHSFISEVVPIDEYEKSLCVRQRCVNLRIEGVSNVLVLSKMYVPFNQLAPRGGIYRFFPVEDQNDFTH